MRGAYPAEDVEMDLTDADILDDELLQEPHVEEAKVPEEIPNAVRFESCVSTRIWVIPAKNCFVALCELVERTKSRSERRVNSSATLCSRGLKRASV